MSIPRLLLLLLLIFPAVSVAAQDPLSFADSLADEGDHYRAITEYKRFIHYHPEDQRIAYARLQIARSLIAGERWAEADRVLEKVWKLHPMSAEALEAKELYADSAFDRGDHDAALQRYSTLGQHKHQHDEHIFRQGLSELERGNTEAAMEHFRLIDKPDLSLELDRYQQLPRKSPRLAGVLSTILPGAGQLYTERPRQAGIAFALNAAFIYAAVESWDNENYATSAIISLFELGWYGGNIYNAVNNAHKYNQRQQRRFIDQLQERFQLSLGWSNDRPTVSTLIRF